MRPMTRTQTRAYGVAISSSRQPLLEAMLCVFAWLVSNVGSMLRTIFNSNTRDWHMGTAQEDQLPTPNDIHVSTFVLRDDRRSASMPQDEAGGRIIKGNRRHECETTEALILRDREAIVSKDGAGSQASPARSNERRDPGQTSHLVPPCSFKSAPAAQPFLDSDPHPELVEGRRNERFMLREISLK